MKIKTWLWSFAFASLFLFSCESKMEEYYKKPEWLEGSAIDVLKGKGNYSIFLEAIEKAQFGTVVGGRGLVTVMAPDDAAFSTYLTAKGYSSISEIPADELNKLVGYHLVDYSYNKQLFSNFQPNGRLNDNPAEKGLYYKHRTKASNPISQANVVEPDGTPRTISVFHKNLYLPVLSKNLFDTKEIDATYNYEYLFPESTWTGEVDGFNISEASVLEYEIPTLNGFVYLVDRVLEPLETIHESLKEEGDYSNFLTLYDRFSNYWYDEDATDNYGNGDSLFIHLHTELPSIASEWPYNGESGIPDWALWSSLTGDAFNVFVPDNNSLEAFYQDTWAAYYESLADVELLPVVFLLYNHVYSGSLVCPEEIKNGDITTYFGTPVSFDPDADVTKSEVCTNGAYYGLNSVQAPPMFNSVTGPAFRDPQYKMLLHMLAYSGLYLPLSSEAINYTFFMPTDTVIVSSGYYDLPIYYYDPTPDIFGDESIKLVDGAPRDMSPNEMANFVNSHIATDLLTVVDGIDIYKSRNNFSYLFVDEDSIASNRIYNEDGTLGSIQIINGSWTNGSCFDIDTVVLTETKQFKYEVGSADETPYLKVYEEFSKLLTNAGLLSLNAPLDFILDRYMLFAPSNSAILNAPAGVIPSDPDSLANYLKYYFVPVPDNDISDFAFPGAGIQGEYITYQGFNDGDTIPPSLLTLNDGGSELTLSAPGGQTANVISNIPKVYGDCAVYSIDELIQP